MGNPLPSRLLIMTPGPNGHDKPLGPICPLKIVNGQSCTCLIQTLDLFIISTSETPQIYHFGKP
jgi:hypothetical protein